MLRIRTAALSGLLVLVLFACGHNVVLEKKSAIVPAGTDLSGLWQLRELDGESARRLARAISDNRAGIRIARSTSTNKPTRERTSRRKSSRKGAVQVFLETGKSLKITQTEHGLFISFDRAVVEEYRFGEHREVSVGPVIGERVSGWVNSSYIIETLDSSGAVLREQYSLLEGAQVLKRTVQIVEGEQQQLNIELLFDRV